MSLQFKNPVVLKKIPSNSLNLKIQVWTFIMKIFRDFSILFKRFVENREGSSYLSLGEILEQHSSKKASLECCFQEIVTAVIVTTLVAWTPLYEKHVALCNDNVKCAKAQS